MAGGRHDPHAARPGALTAGFPKSVDSTPAAARGVDGAFPNTGE